MQMPSHENDPNGPEVATDAHEADGPFHAWNPGLNSTIPPPSPAPGFTVPGRERLYRF